MGTQIITARAMAIEPLIMETRLSPPINHQITTYKLLRAIGDSLEPENVAYLAVEKVVELTGWPTVAILTPDSQGIMVVRAGMGFMLTDIGIIGRAFRTGDTQHITDLIGDSDEGPSYQKLFSALSIPMTRGRRRLGIFNLENDQPFSRDDVLLAESMAEVIALALDHAELYAQSQRRLAAQTALQEAVSAITSSLELPVVLNLIAEQMCRAVNVTSAYICSYDRDTLHSTVLAEHIGKNASPGERVSDLGQTYNLSHDFPEDLGAFERGEVSIRYVEDPQTPSEEREHLRQYDGQTVLSIPLQMGGNTIAYAELWDSRRRRVFTDDEMALCQGIAQHAVIAMENARLFQAIRVDHGRIQALIRSTNDGIVLVGIDGHVLLINEPGCHYLGLDDPPEAWVGRSVFDAITTIESYAFETASAIRAEIERVRHGNELAAEGEFNLPSRVVHWQNLPVLSEDVPVGRLIVLRDVTQEHALENMRNDLTHTMVHDLRGPLTSISISMELLQLMEQSSHMPPERRVQAVERAYASTQKLLGLVEAILELSRLESGHLSLNVQPFLMSDVVNGVLDMQLPRAREKQIELVYCAPDVLPILNADRALMERVVQNLVDNAVKFARPGGRVLVEVLPTAVDSPFLDVVVTDTGCGIPLEMQAHLFEKFSRGMQQERGSGLGLYFCKMVVEAHNGRIWVARSDEGGTAIQFSLPLVAGG